jgi:hypothetical protein
MKRDLIGATATTAVVEYLCWPTITHSAATSGDFVGMAFALGCLGWLGWSVLSSLLPDTAAARERKQKEGLYWKQREEEEQEQHRKQEESQRRADEDKTRREEADLKRKEQIQIWEPDSRIAKLQAFLTPNSGATANEREIARQKIKLIEDIGGGIYTEIYTTGELQAEFTVSGARHTISASGDRSTWTTLFIVRRKSDGQMGSFECQEDRFYYNFKESSWIHRPSFGPECTDDCRRSAYLYDVRTNTVVPHHERHWCRQSDRQ